MESIQEKKIIITGGAGFIGNTLAKRLSNQNNITILCRNLNQRLEPLKDKVKIMQSHLNSEEFLNELENADFLFHFAWQTDLKKSMQNPIRDLETDVKALLNILENCKNNKKIKIIFPSTVTIFGETQNLPVNESEKENPLSIYDTHKLFAEKYLELYYKTYNLKFTTLRLSNVFGEHQKIDNPSRGVLNFMIGKALRGETLTVYGEGDFIRDYCYIENYIDALILAAQSDNTIGKTYILGSGIGTTFIEAMEKIKQIFQETHNKQIKIEKIPFPEDTPQINKRNFIADYSKFNQDTGWTPKISFEEGLSKTINFYISEEK